ncbi:MAG: 3-methyl-2-oxobutanoate hydroxymethyltransferase [Candidatus Omnitrophota bacterium]|jgi:3-methyl-2-oxobutanoate hydroxymethyltransferase
MTAKSFIKNAFVKLGSGKPKLVLTAYTALEARIAEAAGVKYLLVGDSLGPVILGYPSTHEVTEADMLHHLAAVKRGSKKTTIIVDMPLSALNKSTKSILALAKRMQTTGADAIKIEWHKAATSLTSAITRMNIPVIGHIGYTPQYYAPKQFAIRGKTNVDIETLQNQGTAFEQAGACAIVLECIVTKVAQQLTQSLNIPTIGIGSGKYCNSQVLVFHDIVGLNPGFSAKFVKPYAQSHAIQTKAIQKLIQEVEVAKYPSPKYAY